MGDAPGEAIRDLCRAIVKWSQGHRLEIPESMTRYLATEEFAVTNRPKYLKRSRNLLCTQQGSCRNLMDSIERLLDSGLVTESDIGNSYITWASSMPKYKFGMCNQMFRVIVINPVLDSDSVPDEVIDFVVYHEILHLRQDRSKKRRPHNAQFRSWEHAYPNYLGIEKYLREIHSMPSLSDDSL
jgi:predicted metal-dependent hydrolase